MTTLVAIGWYFLLVAILGELAVPIILGLMYKGYSHKIMAISSLGSANSPVRHYFNAWMLAAGVLLILSIPSLYATFYGVSKTLIIISLFCLAAFAVGACILSCFFSVNETKDVVTTASKIHGIGSAVGFMLMLFVPLWLSILSFKAGDTTIGYISATSFVLAIIFFALFIMADKPEFKNSPIGYEGLWQRLSLLFMYLPLACIAARHILFP